jgi:hypothetical protein
MKPPKFEVVCTDNHAFMSFGEDGRPRRPGPEERLESSLTIGKIYDVVDEEHGFYRIVDDTGEDYLYPKEMFRRLR